MVFCWYWPIWCVNGVDDRLAKSDTGLSGCLLMRMFVIFLMLMLGVNSGGSDRLSVIINYCDWEWWWCHCSVVQIVMYNAVDKIWVVL